MADKKERIKSRMIRTASKLWGHKGPQVEESFDPIVGLIMGAFAAELEKIHGSLDDSETRVIERLVEILTPEPITTALPAHAVAYAFPGNKKAEVDDSFQFFYDKKTEQQLKGKKVVKQVFFNPAGRYKLIGGSIKYLASSDTIFQKADIQVKDPMYDSVSGRELPQNSIWIGCELIEEQELPEQMSLFFNIRNQYQSEQFKNEQLINAKWFIDDVEISAVPGISSIHLRDADKLQNLIKSEVEVLEKVIDHVGRYYKNDFVTLNISKNIRNKVNNKRQLPNIFNDVFDEKELKNFTKENILWIEIKFPQIISSELIESLNITLNCFPVINRKLIEFSAAARKYLNIIPLQTEEIFLDLKSVIDRNGTPYKIQLFSSQDNIEQGHAILRQGGVGRYDNRDAKQHIDYLLELLKDESTAFNIIGTDMITSDLKNLDQAIARLEKKIKEINLIKSETNYLLLKPQKKNDLVHLQYWSTNGIFGNKIKSGSKLQSYKSKDIDSDSVYLMTSTIGGTDKPNAMDRVNIYRRALLSKGKLITEADYKMLCYEHFGEKLKSVEVKKGTMNDLVMTSGIVRTIDLFVSLKNFSSFSNSELSFLKQDLFIKLEQNSSNVFPFRVFLK